MKPFTFFGLTDKLRGRQAKRKPSARRIPAEQLLLEELENRTLLSVIPAPTVGIPQNLSNQSGDAFGFLNTGVSPQTAMDPANHTKVVEINAFSDSDEQFFAGTPAKFNDIPNSFMEGRFSTDGGNTWTLLQSTLLPNDQNPISTLLNNLDDPASTTIKTIGTRSTEYTNVSAPSVTFDTHHNFYVLWIESNAASSSGAVLLSEYNFSGASPTTVFDNHVLYQWVGQDPAFNPTIAIDTNQASFADPQVPGAVQTDPLAGKAMFVAWNVNVQEPTPLSPPNEPPQQSQIMIEGSVNGGITFSPEEALPANGSAPQILFTQGTATTTGNTPRVPGGDLVMVWNGSELETPSGTLKWVFDEIDAQVSPFNQAQVNALTTVTYAQEFPNTLYNLNPAAAGLKEDTFAEVPAGTPAGSVVGDFFTDKNEQGHDLVTVTGTTISALEITNGAVLNQTSTSLPSGVTPIAFATGLFAEDSAFPLTGLAFIDKSAGNQYALDIYSYVNGLLTLQSHTALPGKATAIIAAPLGSGHTDLAVAEQVGAFGQVQVFLGRGDGTFTNPIAYQASPITGAMPVSLSTGMFNTNTGKNLDLVVANAGTNQVVILTNNGNGSFVTPVARNTINLSASPLQVVAGDFNGDTKADAAILLSDGTGLVAFGQGDGSFVTGAAGTTPFATQANATQIAVGAFAKTATLDIVSADNLGNLTLVTNTGNGTFSVPTSVNPNVGGTGNFPVALVAADFNGDGLTDLAATSDAPSPALNVTLFEGSTTTVPAVTTFPVTVNIANPNFVLDDLTVSMSLVEPNLSSVLIQLVPTPTIQAALIRAGFAPLITLVDSATDLFGNPTKLGLSGANLGVANYTAPTPINPEFFNHVGATTVDGTSGDTVDRAGGTVFDATAHRTILDQGASAPYIGYYRPIDSDTLAELSSLGFTPAELDGTWSIQITDFTARSGMTPPPEHLVSFSLNLTSGIKQAVSSSSTIASTLAFKSINVDKIPFGGSPFTGNFNNDYSANANTDSGPLGIGPGIAIAADNTLGNFSPYQGRIYVAYNGYGNLEALGGSAQPPTQPSPDVFLMYSDNGGLTWNNAPTQFSNLGLNPITDDSANSNFSEGDRPKFDPTLAVDPATGTLLVTYYDGRFDAAGVNVVNTIQASTNGGATFSSGSFLNVLNNANDFFTGSTQTIEPVPGNENTSPDSFGSNPSSILVYDGHVTVVFASNLNTNYNLLKSSDIAGFFQSDLTSAASIYSTTATFTSGPVVVSGDQGPITQDGSVTVAGHTYTYNNTFTSTGTRQLTGFVVTFDRPVDPAGFINPADVIVMYRSPNNPANNPGISIPIGSVTPLDLGANFGPGLPAGNPLATTFLITLAVSQSAVGTYSYSIGPLISDRIRSKQTGGTTVNGNAMDQNHNGLSGENGPTSTDAFAVPDPLNGIPFDLPYNTNTEPLIIPGPHVIYTYTQYATPPTLAQVDAIENGTIKQTDNVVVNNSVTSIFVLFDRDMNAASFTAASVLSLTGPTGPISSNFVITADPPGTDPALAKRTFEITFVKPSNPALPNPQLLSGTYTVQFAPTATDTLGEAVDTNLNAGLYVLEGNDPTNLNTTVSTYTNSTPVTILPGQTVLSSISVADSYVIEQDLANHQDIQVQLNILYPTDPDLVASLISPNGTIIPLFSNVGQFGSGGQSGFLNSIFDDAASAPIELSAPPFDTGPFNPQKPLSALIGTGSLGKWTLSITDTNGAPASGTKQLTYWTLRLPHSVPGTGLGEATADQYSASLRVFTQSPTNAVSSNSYTAIGPASANGLLYDPATGQYDLVSPNADAGQVNAIAVDPSDPSGNTVYVGGGTGGVWRTTNFLTTNPNGPTWTPLTDLGPTNSLNISGLAIAPVNNNPAKSVIFAITGNSSLYGAAAFPSNPSGQLGMAGVGLLRSEDGGKTWVVLDGLNNVDSSGNILPIQNALRDHTFDGDVGFKVVVDPHETPTGFVVYAAFSGPSGGLYRSKDSGNTWTLIKAGNATDVVLAPASLDVNGNMETLYAGFQSVKTGTSGVYITTSALTTSSLNLMGGGQAVNVRVAFGTNQPIPVLNDALSPNGQGGRIVLATPAITNDPLENIFYQQYLYAAVVNSSGSLMSLYMTKDAGNNWTLVNLSTIKVPAGNIDSQFFQDPYGTNNTTEPNYQPAAHPNGLPQGNYDIALAIDPKNPNIVYLGGTDTAFQAGENIAADKPAGGLIRIDTTKLSDVYSAVGYLNDSPSGALLATAAGSLTVTNPGDPSPTLVLPGDSFTGNAATDGFSYGLIDANNTNPFPLPEAGPPSTLTTYTSSSPVTILPGATVTSTISVADSYRILEDLESKSDIRVEMNINYPTDSDLQVMLVAPDGTRIPLVSGAGGSGSNFTNTIFDDGATLATSNATAPFSTGPYLPVINTVFGENGFSNLNGLSSSGSWQLQITNTNSNPVSGPMQLTNWSLTLPQANAATSNYLNEFRDPNHPFVNPSSLRFVNTTNFTNTGVGAVYSGFNYFVDNSTNYHTLVTFTDPTTGQTRLIVGDDQGVFTGLDNGNGGANPGAVGPGVTAGAAVTGTRNGNLQLAQFTASAAQPSTLAASITGALYYATGAGTGSPQSTANILQTGNITWQTVYGAYQNVTTSFSTSFPGSGQDIATDQTGGGTLYQFRLPGSINQLPFVPTDFFEVTPVVQGNTLEKITSRTTGLLQAGDIPANLGVTGQWGNQQGFNFAVNPIDPSGIVVSSNNGDIFRTSGSTTGFGVNWFEIGTGSQFDTTNANALSFGAPDPAKPNILDDFVYAGTQGGHIYVTFNGGGKWTNISAGLDGSAVQKIVTDPTRGSHDAYAVTLAGVYFMADSTATNATWVKLDDTGGTGALFTLTRGNFGNKNDQIPTLQYLTSIVADWRYAIPNSPGNPSAGTHPVLYVAGNGGVFRSLDQGKTWTYYPDVNADGAVAEGGDLPNTVVTGLTLVVGDLNPANGFVSSSSGLNQLVVTTYGRGDFAIRLNPNALVNGVPISTYLDQPNSGPSVTGISSIVPIPGTALTGITVRFSGPVDPQSFTTSEILLLRAPNGSSIALSATTPITNVTPNPTSGQGSPPSVFNLNFATPQTMVGNYTLSIGTSSTGATITDFSGDPLTQPFSGSLFFTPDVAPSITPNPIAEQVVAPGGTDIVNFTVASAQFNGSLTVTASSSNTGLLPNSDVTLTHSGNNYQLTITPPAGTNTGQSTISITATDPQTLSTTSNFIVIVDQAPVLPQINSSNVITLPHNQFPYSGALNASSPDGNPLSYTATAFGDSLLFDLQQQFRFTTVGMGYFVNGAAAYVLQSPSSNSFGNQFYLVRPTDGALFAYDGSGSYAHSFTGTPIATLGPNVYTDPTLLLNAQPPVDYVTLNTLEQHYHFVQVGGGYFTAGATAFVMQSTTLNSFGNQFYLLRPSDGALFAYDGSGSYASSFLASTPIATLGPNVYTHPSELLNAQASPTLYAQLNQLNQQYDLQELNGSFYTNTYGNQAQWIYSPVLNQFGQHWYTLILSSNGTQATLRAWEGYQDSSVGTVIATLDPSVYANPALLTNATAIPDPAVVATVSGNGNLSIALPNSNYVGTFNVVVTASDGLLSTSQTVKVTSTDNSPTITVKNGSTVISAGGTQSFPHLTLSGGTTDTVTTSDSDGDTVTTTSSVSAFSLPFSLQQRFQFKGVGYLTAGTTAYVMTAVGNNSFGNPYYLISSAGNLYAYDGSGSYAHTIANVAPLATLGVSFYADPTLLMNAQPPVNYTTLNSLQTQFQFTGVGYLTAGATAFVLSANSNNSFNNPFYLLTPNGNLYAYDGSGSYAHTIANVTPTASLDPGVYVNPSLLFNATVAPGLYPQLQQDEQRFDLMQMGGSFFTGLDGHAAKWLYSTIPNVNGQHWYTLVLSADANQALLYAWDGGNNSIPTGAQPVATLDPSVYANPMLLLNAKAPTAPTGETATLAGGTLTLSSAASFVGSFQVTVTATDGIQTTTQTFQVASTDTAPVPNTIPAQTASQSGSPLHITLGSTDAENDPVTFTATAAGYSPAYNLQQIYQFKGIGLVTDSNGVTAYVLSSSVLGGSGGFYLLNSNGAVYAYDGSGSFAHTFANSANLIETLNPNVFTNPSLLTNAQPPVAPSAVVSVAGNTLTVNVATVPVGTVFQVFVTATDGAETTRTSFLVTVTA